MSESSERLRVLLVTTWNTPCGIAEHSAMLKDAVEAADPQIEIVPDPASLDPACFVHSDNPPAIVHLNHHDALHSRWTPEIVQRLRRIGYRVVVTYHDSGVPNSDRCQAMVEAADAAVVHEPFDDLPEGKTRYWRMGVLEPHTPVSPWGMTSRDHRPILGTIGFPFGWKNNTELVRRAKAAGWGCLLIAPSATRQQIDEWIELNDQILVRADFVPRHEAVMWLAGCDATAFGYVNNNTGQSGALLMGIAARKPVIALSTCRQFRALYHDPLARMAIRWVENFNDLETELRVLPRIAKLDEPMVALAEQESWGKLGEKYAQLYRELV